MSHQHDAPQSDQDHDGEEAEPISRFEKYVIVPIITLIVCFGLYLLFAEQFLPREITVYGDQYKWPARSWHDSHDEDYKKNASQFCAEKGLEMQDWKFIVRTSNRGGKSDAYYTFDCK